jgi:hypothetical protein
VFYNAAFRFILFLALFVSQDAKSFCYPPYDNPAHPTVKLEYKRSKFVVKGVVLSERKISSADDPIGYIATLYVIKPLQVFKGNPPHKFVIYSSNTTARFPMDIGGKYIIFTRIGYIGREFIISKSKNSGGLFIDNCGNSGLVKDSASVIVKVKALSQPE